jgi:hypothetical protein
MSKFVVVAAAATHPLGLKDWICPVINGSHSVTKKR